MLGFPLLKEVDSLEYDQFFTLVQTQKSGCAREEKYGLS